MKLTYLGTSASEGFPAIFCSCEYCREARRLKGKNIRSRSQSLINDDLLIDFPPDSYYHFVRDGIDAGAIKYLLITHRHIDHFFPQDLLRRVRPYIFEIKEPVLNMVCSATIANGIDVTNKNVNITPIKAFETISVGNYEITALPARHAPGTEAFIYIIKGDKTLLYAHDTGYFYDSVFSYIEENGIVFDAISLDCANVDFPIEDSSGHMAFDNISRVLKRLYDIGAVTDATLKYVNHFSHKGNALQEPLEAQAALYGCIAAYDGCEVNI